MCSYYSIYFIICKEFFEIFSSIFDFISFAFPIREMNTNLFNN